MGVLGSEVPAWMAKIKAEQDAAKCRVEIEAKGRALIEALMRTDEPKAIWDRLTSALERIAGMAETTTGFRVTVTDVSSPTELAVQVKASTLGVGKIGKLRSVYTNVFFSPSEYRIRCLNQFEEHCTYFRFCTVNHVLSLCSGDREIKPEEAASEIIEHLDSILRAYNR